MKVYEAKKARTKKGMKEEQPPRVFAPPTPTRCCSNKPPSPIHSSPLSTQFVRDPM